MIDTNSTSSVLTSLKASLAAITREFDTAARIVYIDYPVHLNIGDLLINLGAEQFFADNGLNIWRRYYVLDVPARIPHVDDSVVFMMHGGGNFGDIWDRHQSMRENLLALYPRNRFIFLPQTVHFNDPAAEQRSLGRMAAHRNAKFFGRDARSTEILTRAGVADVGMLPDMAHQLWGVLKPSQEPTCAEPFYLIRRDREAKSSLHAGLVPDGAMKVDWDDVISQPHHFMSSITHRLLHLQARLHSSVGNARLWYLVRDRAVQDGVDAVSRHARVVTDRLHAMLLGLLLQREVIAMDNYYGKISTYADTWLAEADLLQFPRS